MNKALLIEAILSSNMRSTTKSFLAAVLKNGPKDSSGGDDLEASGGDTEFPSTPYDAVEEFLAVQADANEHARKPLEWQRPFSEHAMNGTMPPQELMDRYNAYKARVERERENNAVFPSTPYNALEEFMAVQADAKGHERKPLDWQRLFSEHAMNGTMPPEDLMNRYKAYKERVKNAKGGSNS